MGSSRRNASDINILAMLDGLGARPHAKRTMLWYGAGSVLVCGLIGTLAWLAHEPTAHLDSTMVAGGLPPPPATAAAASAPPVQVERVSDTLAAPATSQAAGGATIVNLPDEPRPALAAKPGADDPPLRILPAPKPAPVARAPAPKSPAVHLPPARSAAASAHPAAHASPKRGAPAIKPLPAPAAVDTDVALISAIIQHAANRREATEDAGCGDKPCGPRMPARP